MEIIGSIEWPGGEEVTTVWRRQTDGCPVWWTGPADEVAGVQAEVEDDLFLDQHQVNIPCLELDLFERFEEYMADTDRNLLAEIDALLEKVRAAT